MGEYGIINLYILFAPVAGQNGKSRKEREYPWKRRFFQVDTHMERKDYRKFLYIATFFQNPFVIPAILVMCGVGAVLASRQMGRSDLFYMVALWGAISALVFSAVCFNVGRARTAAGIAAQQAGALDRRLVMSFSEQEFFWKNPARDTSRHLTYEEFHLLMETKDYLHLLSSPNTRSPLLCKRDMKEEELDSFSAFIRRKFGKRYRKINL